MHLVIYTIQVMRKLFLWKLGTIILYFTQPTLSTNRIYFDLNLNSLDYLCTFFDTTFEQLGPGLWTLSLKKEGEMNKNITVSFDLQKWYKNKVLADGWWCLLISDIYSCLHEISTQCCYIMFTTWVTLTMVTQLCGNYIFHLAQ